MSDSESEDGTVAKSFKYSDDLWDCFEIISKKAEIGLESLKDVASILKARTDIEAQYSHQLSQLYERALAGKRSGLKKLFKSRTNAVVSESGTVRDAWQNMIENINVKGKIHSDVATALSEGVVQALLEFAKDYEAQIKNLDKRGKASIAQYNAAKDAAEAAKNSYLRWSYEAELYEILLDQATKDVSIKPKEWSKLSNKKNMTKEKSRDAKEEYENLLKKANEMQHKHLTEEMPKVLDEYQHWDLIRVKVMKSNLKRFNDARSDIPPQIVKMLANDAESVKNIDAETDISQFVEENKTYAIPPSDIPFVQYENKLDPNDETIWQKRKGKRSQKPPDALTLLQGPAKPVVSARKRLFGASLEEIIKLQEDEDAVPLILSTLTTKLFKLGAQRSEGIFRVPAPATKVVEAKEAFEELNYEFEIDDVAVAAAILKLWLRELKHPLIPDNLYSVAISLPDDPMKMFQQLPLVNQRSIEHIAKFLLTMARAEYVKETFMGMENLAMVFTPSFLRCQSDDPSVVLQNASQEKVFVSRLLEAFRPKFGDDLSVADWISSDETKPAPAQVKVTEADLEEIEEVDSEDDDIVESDDDDNHFDTEISDLKEVELETGDDIKEVSGSIRMERM